ncbi:hypothetical protein B0H14DRAFT_2593469 [Mycena olivaceomarginata]|nr:hypothetical protein B0H14DRAFT_2593469 [Mycena olivaceomarginata]
MAIPAIIYSRSGRASLAALALFVPRDWRYRSSYTDGSRWGDCIGWHAIRPSHCVWMKIITAPHPNPSLGGVSGVEARAAMKERRKAMQASYEARKRAEFNAGKGKATVLGTSGIGSSSGAGGASVSSQIPVRLTTSGRVLSRSAHHEPACAVELAHLGILGHCGALREELSHELDRNDWPDFGPLLQ